MSEDKTTISIPQSITVGELAERLDLTVSKLIMEMMGAGIMATVNQKLDFETAEIVIAEIDSELVVELEEKEIVNERKDREIETKVSRAPVVAVMGHVDHGKTSLLDAIRGADTAADESGGITQHISAYQITHKDRPITFLDTPGHEAFAAIREHGAKLTDLALIVVAADDGIKPQTKEAIKYASVAGVKIVVAINKIDKDGIDLNRIKQQLTDEGLQPEEWGGETVIVEVSAKTKQGIDNLLEMVLLVTDVEELSADDSGLGEGLVIEAHTEQGRGAVATVLVEHGKIGKGSFLSVGSTYGKIRTITNHAGEDLKEAGASVPAILTGFKDLPRFGDVFYQHATEKEARKASENYDAGDDDRGSLTVTGAQMLALIDEKNTVKELPVIIKADVQGSLKSAIDSIRSLENEEVRVKLVAYGVGDVTENDVTMATTADAVVYGFNVGMPVAIKQQAIRDEAQVKLYKVIYEMLDDVKENLSDLLSDEVIEEDLGRLLVRGVFRTTKQEIICGGEVTKGFARPGALVKVFRDDELIGEAEVTSVKQQSQEAKEVPAGEMCGLQLAITDKLVVKEDDRLELFTRSVKERTL